MHKVKTKPYTLTAYVNAQRQIVRVITCDYCFGNLRHTPYIEHYFDRKSFNQWFKIIALIDRTRKQKQNKTVIQVVAWRLLKL